MTDDEWRSPADDLHSFYGNPSVPSVTVSPSYTMPQFFPPLRTRAPPHSPSSPPRTPAVTDNLTFVLSKAFTGTGNVTGARWLKMFEHDIRSLKRNHVFPPARYLHYLDMLLADEAADWADGTPEVSELLNTDQPTQETVERVKTLFKDRFSAKPADEPVTYEAIKIRDLMEIGNLVQEPQEPISYYYRRAVFLLEKFGGRDQPEETERPLAPAEKSLLDFVMGTFIDGIRNPEIKEKVNEGHVKPDPSLTELYHLAEQADRALKSAKPSGNPSAKQKEAQRQREAYQRNPRDAELAAAQAELQAVMQDQQVLRYSFEARTSSSGFFGSVSQSAQDPSSNRPPICSYIRPGPSSSTSLFGTHEPLLPTPSAPDSPPCSPSASDLDF